MLVVLMSTGLLLTIQSLREVADSAYDRSLSGAIRAIDLRISTESGGLGIELPYPLFESFQATADGEVLFRVSTDDGLVQIGDALLPVPAKLRPNEVTFYNATYFGRSIRVGAYMRALDPPLYGAKQGQNLIIEVAETTGSRQEFLRTVLSRTMLRDFSALLAVTLLLALGLHAGLKPLRALRDRLDQRSSDDLRQVDPTGLPLDVQPLVRSVNRLVDRHRLQAEAQRRFIEDASHQLKTPLAVLRAQIDLASQTEKPERLDEIHAAMREIVTRSARLTGQLLSLAHARNDAMWRDGSDRPIDVSKLLDDVVRLHVGPARQRRILLEVDVAADIPAMNAPEALLFEAISNLVDNAIIASPRNGRVILSAYRQGTASFIDVRDFGTGLSDTMLHKLRSGQRFNINEEQRSEPTSSGLGLTIVQQIMKTLGGELILKNMPDGGLSAGMRIPDTK
ncbi:sensor histidine kinase [Falsirhodobacter sp. 20TX0035]|uniref:sensor histidine kinase n=1 Tax=Falsirhodobacter sp. 20TX0035 TaxID=3022019 RepID=UPI00232CB46A|nr:sensor histidine kinase [Falsirhodobacter sp. 20TX0035]MDB6454176.1 sensor histidine kinase N-terminal domain-containing protein [Falsirhodobacter sp. 20TX0035]